MINTFINLKTNVHAPALSAYHSVQKIGRIYHSEKIMGGSSAYSIDKLSHDTVIDRQ